MSALATLICLAFIGYLFWTDFKKPNSPSNALWIPLLWMFIAGSRWTSSWLNLSQPLDSATAYAEGSPLDRAVFFSLILAGVVVLTRRKLDWGELLSKNKWIVFYFGYCLVSILWTDEPFILFKRWVKDLGNPVMALVILSEKNPYEACGAVLRRLAFLLLPLSVLFIRYYPDLGRSYHVDGSPMYTGVGHQKNDLGLMCLITGIYFAWYFLRMRTTEFKLLNLENSWDFLLILMLAWLLRMSNSQTSLVCLVVTIGVLLVSRVGFIAKKPSRIVVLGVSSALIFAVLESTLHIKDFILELLGRDPTLTNRTEVWEVLRKFEVNSIIGAGFMSFWSGRRLEGIWAILGVGINQAHNGYLEQYFNLGYVGVGLIGIIILSGLLKIRQRLDMDYSSAILRLCIILSAVFYNYTEAAFYGISNIWLLFLLASIEMPGQQGKQGAELVAAMDKLGKPLAMPYFRYKKSRAKGESKKHAT